MVWEKLSKLFEIFFSFALFCEALATTPNSDRNSDSSRSNNRNNARNIKRRREAENNNVNRNSNNNQYCSMVWALKQKNSKNSNVSQTFWNCVVRFSPFLTSTGLNSCLNPRHSMTQVTNRVAELKGSPYKTREVILG